MSERITRQSFWRSGLVYLLGLGAFLLIANFVPQPRLRGAPLQIVSLILALAPALLWLAFFYQQDRREPEPRRIVFRVFLFGALIAAGAGIPLVSSVFRVNSWIGTDPWVRIAALILIVGFTQEYCKFAVVRYLVFPTPEYDDRVDGVIYGVAAGLGYATALNLDYVIANQGVVLLVGGIRIVETALAQASYAAITGYFLAGARHGAKPLWWVPLGLTLAATLNGVMAFARRAVSTQGLDFRPLNALLLAVAVVVVTLVTLYVAIRRIDQRAARLELQEKTHE